MKSSFHFLDVDLLSRCSCVSTVTVAGSFRVYSALAGCVCVCTV